MSGISSVAISKNKFWVFLSILAVGAMILCGIATSKYGAGVSSDSAKYLGVAQNLLDGKGLYDHKGAPLLAWPPLHSMIIASLSWLTSLDVFVVGWYFNVLLMGLNVFLSGVIVFRIFKDKPLYAYLASLFVFLSLSSLRIHANVSSDPFYLTLTLGFLVAVHDYVTKRSYAAFAWMILFSMLAPIQRYVGLVVAITAGIVILIENRKSLRILLRDGFILAILSILPITWWLVVHNIMTYGMLWDTGPQEFDVWMNISLALTKMLHWFVPYLSFLMPVLTKPWIPLGVLALFLLLVNRKGRNNGRAWIEAFTAPSVYPTIVHAAVYFIVLALTVVTNDHRDLYSDRYYVILLVPTAIFVLLTFDKLVVPHLNLSSQQLQTGLMLIFGLWSIYPVYSIGEYLQKARVQGEPSNYNFYNWKHYREMGAILEMQRIRAAEPESIFYSNYVDAVWFYTRKPVALLPRGDIEPANGYAGWPHGQSGYIVWFEPNEYKHYLSPQKIAEFADVELIYNGKGGQIYYVQAR